jgi:hypothetical protein
MLSEISCLHVLGFLLAYILEFLLIDVRGVPSDFLIPNGVRDFHFKSTNCKSSCYSNSSQILVEIL